MAEESKGIDFRQTLGHDILLMYLSEIADLDIFCLAEIKRATDNIHGLITLYNTYVQPLIKGMQLDMDKTL